jgi:hypothetical protein
MTTTEETQESGRSKLWYLLLLYKRERQVSLYLKVFFFVVAFRTVLNGLAFPQELIVTENTP